MQSTLSRSDVEKPGFSTSETYNINMATFENSQQEEFLAILKNFKITTNEIGTMPVTEWIKYLHAIIHG